MARLGLSADLTADLAAVPAVQSLSLLSLAAYACVRACVRAQVPFLLYNVMFTALPIVIFGVVDQVSQPVRRSGAACRGWLHHNGDWFAAR